MTDGGEVMPSHPDRVRRNNEPSPRSQYFMNVKEVPCSMCGVVFWADLWGDQLPPYFCPEHIDRAPWRLAMK